uniref:Uncharacterized protein n=1 Tax=Ciona savignyi TaxID=51511 RepID=H2Z4J3_CIOSA
SAQDNLDSYWGEWQPWSACSNDCGIGERERIRPCEGAGECDYSCDNCGDYEKEDCLNDNPCPEWTPWRPVSPCTVTCGWGYRGMERTCDGVGCVG